MAESISAMPKEIAQWLNSHTEIFSDILFVTEFPPVPKATPLNRTIVSVGLETVSITDYFTENSEGVLVPDEYCRLANIRVRFSIYVPYSSGGTACHEAFTRIVDCLNFKSDLNLKESGCESITADRETDAFVMKSWIDIEAQFCPAESSAIQYESFLPKTFFCGSHLNNESIHVTPEEKEKWNTGITIGTYFGTNTATRSISLGFKPSAVIVAPVSAPMFYADTEGLSYCLCSVSSVNGDGAGIKLTSDGFRIVQSTSENYGNTFSKLNKLNIDYIYIAFK